MTDDGGGVNVASLSQALYEFAVELRQLAYTMPGRTGEPAYRPERADAALRQEHPYSGGTCHGHGGRAQVLAL